MFRGIYTATSGMLSAQRKQEVLTNNLANAQTPGFKQEHAVSRAFPDILMERIRDQQMVLPNRVLPGRGVPIGVLHTGVYTQEAIPSFIQGTLQQTGRTLDMAIVDQGLPVNPQTNQRGALFFVVESPQGELRYTRNGQFTLDEQGYLITGEGYRVLNEQRAPIQLTGESFQLAADGRIIIPQALTEQAGEADPEQEEAIAPERLFLAYIERPEQELEREGNGVWRLNAEAAPPTVAEVPFINGGNNEAPSYFVLQAHIEGSNVDVTQTMTEMLSVFRLYEANQRVLQTYDRNMEKAVNEIGRVF